ncbi:hypothetical protein MXB_3757 [Myxobolus squamalis]|nr:hypothetical protein MXB_3757 [Myxobolus squamalis]
MLLALLLKTLSYKDFLDKMIQNVLISIKKPPSYGILLTILCQQLFGRGHQEIFWRHFLRPYNIKLKKFLHSYMLQHKIIDKKYLCTEITRDPLFPNILTFHYSVDFHDKKIVEKGEAILQDKASCIPPYILNPPADSCVLDCCAAPGNKTSQLSEIMKNKGLIHINALIIGSSIFSWIHPVPRQVS